MKCISLEKLLHPFFVCAVAGETLVVYSPVPLKRQVVTRWIRFVYQDQFTGPLIVLPSGLVQRATCATIIFIFLSVFMSREWFQEAAPIPLRL